MLVGDIVVIDFSKPIDYYFNKQEFLNDVVKGTYKNLWRIVEKIKTIGFEDHSWIKHITIDFTILLPNELLIGIDVIRDKKINDLLC